MYILKIQTETMRLNMNTFYDKCHLYRYQQNQICF